MGSAVVALSRVDFLNYPVPPVTQTRTYLVAVLEKVEEKIDLNRRMSECLESMARAIFKAWFVDFEPVRVKMEGRGQRQQMPRPLLALFPDQLVHSELGQIPETWPIGTVADLADVVGGTTPSTTNPSFWENGTHYWATPKDLSYLQFPVVLKTERQITDSGLAQIGSGLLPAGTVLLSSRAPIGYLGITQIPVAINQGFIAIKPKPCASNLFLLLWAHFSNAEILSRANGSTFLEISKSNFRAIPLVLPPPTIMTAFTALVEPIFARIVANERESLMLTTLRDTLLPKLITGEIRVTNAEPLIVGSLT
ncbi:MAG: restriction endonuclease subunit S [Candidatus Obscuribacterales bacterium]|nr:restriction endonuclease subunit S [Candidatus Obscuribacterales bacterium]